MVSQTKWESAGKFQVRARNWCSRSFKNRARKPQCSWTSKITQWNNKKNTSKQRSVCHKRFRHKLHENSGGQSAKKAINCVAFSASFHVELKTYTSHAYHITPQVHRKSNKIKVWLQERNSQTKYENVRVKSGLRHEIGAPGASETE